MSHAAITVAERKAYAVGKKFSLEVKNHQAGNVVMAFMRGGKESVISWAYVFEAGTQNHRSSISDVTDEERKNVFVTLVEKAIIKEREDSAKSQILSDNEVASLLL